jgi:hypothetical protein
MGTARKEVFSDPLANQYCGMLHVVRDTVFVEPGFNVHVACTTTDISANSSFTATSWTTKTQE